MKNRLYKAKVFVIDTLVFILSGVAFSTGLNCFISQNDILNGGFTGIATILNHIWGLPIGTTIFVLNIPLFIISKKKLGTNFVIRTVWATLITSAIIDIGAILPVYRGSLLLSSVIGGVLIGIALGIIFVRNATTGGVDIIAKLTQIRYPHLTLGKSILIFDAIIVIIGGIIYKNFQSVLYAVVVIFATAQVLDFIIKKLTLTR